MKGTGDHREEPRVPTHAPARVEPLESIFSSSGPATIEEVSSCGLRLRTEVRLHPGEDLSVKVAGEACPLRARTLWVREGPPLHHGGRKTWIAGCKLDPRSIGKVHVAMKVDVQTPFPWRRLLVIAAAIGALALLIYLSKHLETLLGIG